MDDWLQRNLTKPAVKNPFMQTENFADGWTDDQYVNFRDRIHSYREWIDEAYEEQNRSESISKWRRVFGEDFASGVVLDEGRSVSKALVAEVRRTVLEASHFAGDLVDAIKRFGGRILPVSFNRKSYMEAPRWKRATGQTMTVTVRADLHASKHGTQIIWPVQMRPQRSRTTCAVSSKRLRTTTPAGSHSSIAAFTWSKPS